MNKKKNAPKLQTHLSFYLKFSASSSQPIPSFISSSILFLIFLFFQNFRADFWACLFLYAGVELNQDAVGFLVCGSQEKLCSIGGVFSCDSVI
ncbi:hypothetical protein VNO77_01594 [Canavalia gladiata]|uniref:Uncharacterized protein n=1 Tax=Canavalia gladiata TaxID=3824 RepID=A0AAN9MWP8_CANGL